MSDINLKDILTIRCANDKDASITINGYKGFCSITLFANKKIVFKQTMNRKFTLLLAKGFRKALTLNPGEKAGVLVLNTWKAEDKKGEWQAVCHIRILKTDEGVIAFGVKSKDNDTEYQFLLRGGGAMTADWAKTPAEQSAIETEGFIDLLENFHIYEAIARFDRPEKPGGSSNTSKSSSDTIF
jgi:hypothetical protein